MPSLHGAHQRLLRDRESISQSRETVRARIGAVRRSGCTWLLIAKELGGVTYQAAYRMSRSHEEPDDE